MRNPVDPNKKPAKTDDKNQFSESGIFVREDDQDWGSSGMNDIQVNLE